MFELAPVSLWLEDLSGTRSLMDQWRAQGVIDIEAYLRKEPARVGDCFAGVRLIKVNRRTLTLFEADSLEHLVENLHIVFHDMTFDRQVEELGMFWRGVTQFSMAAINHTLSGRPLDIRLSFNILPGHEDDWARVLVAIEDLTEREAAFRAKQRSESYFRNLFEHSPTSLWVQDLTEVKAALDGLRDAGVADIPAFLHANPEVPGRWMNLVRVRDANSRTLNMFKAASVPVLIDRFADVFRAESHLAFMHLLVAMWSGTPFDHREVVTYALDGSLIHAQVQCSVLSEHSDDWSTVFLALIDITARKQAEAHLEFINAHDAVTRLYNRSFYVQELKRLEDERISPVSIVVADLNGLKRVNDRVGHAAGDALLRRCGDMLSATVGDAYPAARIGGDEFVILMPFAGAAETVALVKTLHDLMAAETHDDPTMAISLATGAATSRPDEPLESVFARADARMYACKQAYYAANATLSRRMSDEEALGRRRGERAKAVVRARR